MRARRSVPTCICRCSRASTRCSVRCGGATIATGYLAKIAGLRRRIPEMRFGTDVIVGFPGETETDFARDAGAARRGRLRHGLLVHVLPAARHARGRAGGHDRIGDQVRASGPAPGASDCDPGDSGTATWIGAIGGGSRRGAEPSGDARADGTHPGEPHRPFPGPATARADSEPYGSRMQPRSRSGASRSTRALDRLGIAPYIVPTDAGGTEGRARSMPVEMKIKGLMIDPVSNMPIIILKRRRRGRRFSRSGSGSSRPTPSPCSSRRSCRRDR